MIISEKREEEEQYRGRGLRIQTTMYKINKLREYIIQYREYASLVAQMVKHLSAMREIWVRSLGREDPQEKEMATHAVLLPGKFHERRSLVGYSPWGLKKLDMTEQLY